MNSSDFSPIKFLNGRQISVHHGNVFYKEKYIYKVTSKTSRKMELKGFWCQKKLKPMHTRVFRNLTENAIMKKTVCILNIFVQK